VLRFLREWWFVAFALVLLAAGLFVERFFCRYCARWGGAGDSRAHAHVRLVRRYRECGNPCMRCFNECRCRRSIRKGTSIRRMHQLLHCQVLYHHDYKCPVRIQRRVRREKREATARPAASAAVGMSAVVRPRLGDTA